MCAHCLYVRRAEELEKLSIVSDEIVRVDNLFVCLLGV